MTFSLSRARLVLSVALSALFVAAGVGIIVWALGPFFEGGEVSAGALLLFAGLAGPQTLLFTAVGVLGVVTFGVFGTIAVRMLLRRDRTALAVDESGFTDTSSATAAGRVAWTETVGMRSVRMQRQEFLVVDVVDPQAVIDRQPTVGRRRTARANARLVGSPVCVSPKLIAAPRDEVLAAFEEHGRLRPGFYRGTPSAPEPQGPMATPPA